MCVCVRVRVFPVAQMELLLMSVLFCICEIVEKWASALLQSEVQVCLGLKRKNGVFGETNLCTYCFPAIWTFTQQFSAWKSFASIKKHKPGCLAMRVQQLITGMPFLTHSWNLSEWKILHALLRHVFCIFWLCAYTSTCLARSQIRVFNSQKCTYSFFLWRRKVKGRLCILVLITEQFEVLWEWGWRLGHVYRLGICS